MRFFDLGREAAGLAGFELGPLLAHGTSGSTFEGRRSIGGAPVVVKALAPVVEAAPAVRAAVVRDLERWIGVAHPGLAATLAVGSCRGRTVAVLERAAGHAVSAWLAERGPLPCDAAVALVADLAAALEHAHGLGLRVGDVRAAKTHFDGTRACLTDLGFSRAAPFAAGFGEHGLSFGHPTYLAPEVLQEEQREPTPASDLYALGVLFYELVCGRPPFRGDVARVLEQHCTAPLPEPPPGVAVSTAVAGVILRLTAKAPNERLQDAAALHVALTRLRAGRPFRIVLRAATPSGAAMSREDWAAVSASVSAAPPQWSEGSIAEAALDEAADVDDESEPLPVLRPAGPARHGVDPDDDDAADEALQDPAAGSRVHVGERIGREPLGTVFAGRLTGFAGAVVVKVVKRRLTRHADIFARVLEALRRAATVRHPNVVPVLEVRTVSGREAVVAERPPGRTLRELLVAGGKLPAGEALALATDVARALAEAEARGLAHGDVRPERIHVDEGVARLSGFGEAEATALGHRRLGLRLGEAVYAAPELVQERLVAPTAAADAYALGVVLYEALCGSPPFSAPTARDVLRAHLLQGVPAPPPAAGVPGRVGALLLRLLAKAPSARPATAAALRDELARCLADLGGAAAALEGEEGGSPAAGEAWRRAAEANRPEPTWSPARLRRRHPPSGNAFAATTPGQYEDLARLVREADAGPRRAPVVAVASCVGLSLLALAMLAWTQVSAARRARRWDEQVAAALARVPEGDGAWVRAALPRADEGPSELDAPGVRLWRLARDAADALDERPWAGGARPLDDLDRLDASTRETLPPAVLARLHCLRGWAVLSVDATAAAGAFERARDLAAALEGLALASARRIPAAEPGAAAAAGSEGSAVEAARVAACAAAAGRYEEAARAALREIGTGGGGAPPPPALPGERGARATHGDGARERRRAAAERARFLRCVEQAAALRLSAGDVGAALRALGLLAEPGVPPPSHGLLVLRGDLLFVRGDAMAARGDYEHVARAPGLSPGMREAATLGLVRCELAASRLAEARARLALLPPGLDRAILLALLAALAGDGGTDPPEGASEVAALEAREEPLAVLASWNARLTRRRVAPGAEPELARAAVRLRPAAGADELVRDGSAATATRRPGRLLHALRVHACLQRGDTAGAQRALTDLRAAGPTTHGPCVPVLLDHVLSVADEACLPDVVEAAVALARLDPPAMTAALRTRLGARPASGLASLALARLERDASQAQAAREAFERARDALPLDPAPCLELGRLLRAAPAAARSGEDATAAACEALAFAVARAPALVEARVELAAALLDAERYAEAREALVAVPPGAVDRVRHLELLAQAAEGLDPQGSEAARCYDLALQVASAAERARLWPAALRVYERAGQWGAARARLDDLAHGDPGWLSELARLCLDRRVGDVVGALDAAERLARLRPRDAAAPALRARALVVRSDAAWREQRREDARRDLDDAERAALDALALDPASRDALWARLDVTLRRATPADRGRAPPAGTWRVLLDLGEPHVHVASALVARARAEREARPLAAEAALRVALDVDPACRPAYGALAELLRAQGGRDAELAELAERRRRAGLSE